MPFERTEIWRVIVEMKEDPLLYQDHILVVKKVEVKFLLSKITMKMDVFLPTQNVNEIAPKVVSVEEAYHCKSCEGKEEDF